MVGLPTVRRYLLFSFDFISLLLFLKKDQWFRRFHWFHWFWTFRKQLEINFAFLVLVSRGNDIYVSRILFLVVP